MTRAPSQGAGLGMVVMTSAFASAAVGLVAASPGGLAAMLGLPLAPAVLVNLAALFLAGAALLGRMPRIWLLAPLALYVGWPAATALLRYETERTIADLMTRSRLIAPVSADADLIFASNDAFATAVRRHLVGGRVFAGSDEIQVVRSVVAKAKPDAAPSYSYRVDGRIISGPSEIRAFRSPIEIASAKCDDPGVQQSYGRLTERIALGGAIAFECRFSRAAPAPPPGLLITPTESRNRFGRHINRYVIHARSAEGALTRVGEFHFGFARVWDVSFAPLWYTLCNSAECWIEPASRASVSFAGARTLDGTTGGLGPDFAPVKALMDMLGRETRAEPPEL